MAAEEFVFGVEDCKIAVRNSAGSYGTLFDVEAINQVQLTLETTSAQLEGDDLIKAIASKVTSARVQARFGFKSLELYEIFTNATYNLGTSGGYVQFDNLAPGYFGMIAKLDKAEAEGNYFFFFPKIKAMSGFSIQGNYGNFVIPEITLMGIADPPYGIVRIYEYENTTPITVIPPANP